MMLNVISIILIAALCFPGALGAAGRQTPEPAPGSAEQALNAALEAAQLTADQVSDVRTEYEIDDSKAAYEVEFRDGDWEYEYTVDAETGAILESDRDYDPPAVDVPSKPVLETPAVDRLTDEEAKAIALTHAGVDQTDVIRLRTEFDVDDGIAEWEIEFNLGNWEYEYEINADTGEILSWERDDD